MGGNESVEVTAGIWGFLVLFGLALACWFLFRSMNTHIRRVNFTERETGRRTPGQDVTLDDGSHDRPVAGTGRDGLVEVDERPDDPIGGPGH